LATAHKRKISKRIPKTHVVPVRPAKTRLFRVLPPPFWIWLIAALFASADYSLYMHDQRAIIIATEIASDTDSVAQLFYDTGRGFNEVQSALVPVRRSATPVAIRFSIPYVSPILALRLDPVRSTGSGTIGAIVLSTADGTILNRIPAPNIAAANQVTVAPARDLVQYRTSPDATDPQTIIPLPDRLELRFGTRALLVHRLPWSVFTGFIAAGLVFLILFTSISIAGPQPTLRKTLVAAADKLAVRLTGLEVIQVDRVAVLSFGAILVTFLGLALLQLHGSSLGIFSVALPQGAQNYKPIAGTPRLIRSDEWAFHTPAILGQLFRPDKLAVEPGIIGVSKSVVVGNLPAWHFSMLFRPQFWALFVLPPAVAFSVYWQFKGVLLCCGVFLLVLLMTESGVVASVGALWCMFSAHIQWAYSWPSLLPEMIGLMGLTVCSLCALLVLKITRHTIVAGALCVFFAINFALCVYLPHQIPLVWVGITVFCWWTLLRWRSIIDRPFIRARLAVLASTLAAIALFGTVFYLDVQPAIHAIADTFYPGHRSMSGGGQLFPVYVAHFLPFSLKEFSIPHALGNICEGSGFFWLAPLTLLRAPGSDRRRRTALTALWVLGLSLFVWMFFPIPRAVGALFQLDKSGGLRCLPALGVVNILIVCVWMSSPSANWRVWFHRPRNTSGLIAVWLGCVLVSLAMIGCANDALARFFSWGSILGGACLVATFAFGVLKRLAGALSLMVVILNLLFNIDANPLDRGISTVTASPLYQIIRSDRKLLDGKWMIYSHAGIPAGFFTAVGCKVLNGMKYAPDLSFFEMFDQQGLSRNQYNQSGFLLTESLAAGAQPVIQALSPGVVSVQVNPSDPRLKRAGVRHIAFEGPPPAGMAAGLKEIVGPIGGMWLFDVP